MLIFVVLYSPLSSANDSFWPVHKLVLTLSDIFFFLLGFYSPRVVCPFKISQDISLEISTSLRQLSLISQQSSFMAILGFEQ